VGSRKNFSAERNTPQSSSDSRFRHDLLSGETSNNDLSKSSAKVRNLGEPNRAYNLSLLDDVNRKIIGLLEQDVFVSQTDIARALGLSQSSIALRLYKLRKSGILTETAGINLKNVGLEMCRVDVDSSDPRAITDWSKSCPLFMNGSIGIGGSNASLYFAGEDLVMFQYIIDEHIRRLKGVTEVHFSPIVSWGKEYIAPLRLDVSKTGTPPCNLLPFCPRCPANPDYDGKVWDK
jgi:DNA-binding Lrp family transcriptional regulator